MDISSNAKYPANKLSNFSANHFILDDVECNSMEAFLQSIKFKSSDMQKEICKLVGLGAKKRGSNKKWFRKQVLYWQGVEYKRDSQEYQDLLDRAYNAMYEQSKSFRKALAQTVGCSITHSIGKHKKSETVLTTQEFCSRLMILRDYGKIER